MEKRGADLRTDVICDFESFGSARQFFHAVRRAVTDIPMLNERVRDGVDGIERIRADTGHQKNATGDPTASTAIFLLEIASKELSRLRETLERQEELVGHALVVIECTRAGLGEKFADALDARYVDALTWDGAAEALGCSDRTAQTRCDVALDWLDSGGLREISAAA